VTDEPTDPTACPNPDDAAYVALWDQYMSLKKDNEKKELGLVRQFGPNARLDQMQGLEARLEMFTNAVLPVTEPARIVFEIEWQKLLKASLDAMGIEIHKAIREQRKKADQQASGLVLPPGTDRKLIVPPGT
jgi:hypothetical protein